MAIETEKPFKVIVAGGSVVGLVLANALEKAGIDFVVLEKGAIAPDLGASVSVFSNTARVLEQMGIWRTIQAETIPMMRMTCYNERGDLFERSNAPGLAAAKSKRSNVILERWAYLRALYDNLEDKSKVREHSGIVGYVEEENGVRVRTAKGEDVSGSILVGADGCHSTVRRLLADSVAESDPVRAKQLSEGFKATYRCLFGTSKNQRRDAPSHVFLPGGEIHNRFCTGFAGTAFAGVEGLVFWFLYVQEDKPSEYPHCPRYTEKDAQDTMDKFGHKRLGPGYTFADLWETRIRAKMVPLEEGVIQAPWNNDGRVVLLGDAVCKATVNRGLGANFHTEGVCHLVNELYRLLQHCPDPSTQQVMGVFRKYEEKQRPRAVICVKTSGRATRLEAQDSWSDWFLGMLIFPWIPDRVKVKWMMGLIDPAGTPRLEFLPDPDEKP